MNIKINTTRNYRKSVVLKMQLKICKHPELVKSVAAAWGTGALVNLTGWGSNGLTNEPPCEYYYYYRNTETFKKILHMFPHAQHYVNLCFSQTVPNWLVSCLCSSLLLQKHVTLLKSYYCLSKNIQHEPKTGKKSNDRDLRLMIESLSSKMQIT